MIGVESKVIHCAIANRVSVLILPKGFAVPTDGSRILSDSPRRATVTLVVERAVIWKARFLWRRVKPDVTDIGTGPQRDVERLNAAIEIVIVQGILVVIDARRGTGDFEAHKPDSIVSRIRLLLSYRRACPTFDGRFHSLWQPHRGKCEVRCAVNKELAVGSVVIHVALPRMGLTPLVFKRIQVCRFREIGCTRIECRVQIGDINANPVRYVIMNVPIVVAWIWIRWESSGERIRPGTRTKQVPPSVLSGEIRIGAART